jgi:uncharacterized protein GlcG (DUF336 family)
MRDPGRWLVVGLLAISLGGATALAQLPARKLGPFGDKPAGPQSLPGDNLPPFNMLDSKGKLIPMPKLDKPLHAADGKPESAAPGTNLAEATRMASAAVADCSAKGFRIGVAVIDSIGEVRAMLTADGSDGSHVFVAHRKALTALVFGTTSLKANQDVLSGAAPASKITPDMFVMGGAVPITKDGKVIGAIGVSGAAGGSPPGKADEDCASAGLRAGGPQFK